MSAETRATIYKILTYVSIGVCIFLFDAAMVAHEIPTIRLLAVLWFLSCFPIAGFAALTDRAEKEAAENARARRAARKNRRTF